MIPFFTKVIMFPFSLLYGSVIILRNLLYDTNILQSFKFNTKIISVGNLIMGGSGKTPHVEYIVKILLKKKHSTSIISRGYKRVTKGLIILSENENFRTVGDEPIQYFKKFKGEIDVIVSENRKKAIEVIEKGDSEFVVMDDAYQQRSIDADVNILLSSIKKPFFKDYIFPSGKLREFRCNANRADVLIFSGCRNDITSKQQEIIKLKSQKFLKKNIPILFSSIIYGNPISVFGKDIKNKVVAISSIAYPRDFFNYINSTFDVLGSYDFPDHHIYKDEEIIKIFQAHGDDITIITTEKDAVKLCEYKHLLDSKSVYYIPISIKFLNSHSISEYLPE